MIGLNSHSYIKVTVRILFKKNCQENNSLNKLNLIKLNTMKITNIPMSCTNILSFYYFYVIIRNYKNNKKTK